MTKKPIIVLAINPGTRYLGIAVFQGPELRDWRIKAFKGKWSKEKMVNIKTIISGFIEQYEPNALAIKKLHPSRSSLNLKTLVTQIKRLCQRKGLKIYEYSIKDLDNFFAPEEKINKKNMSEMVAFHYPVLFNEFNKEKISKNPYYLRMFEAVALGSICFYQLDKH